MRLLDLFAGIGGFSLAAYWIGWETIAFCEQDRKCQERLRLRFGHDIPIYDDIRTFPTKLFRGRADILTAGFPCQPFSTAGQRKGTADDRYLWDEVVRVVSETKPAWVCGENVAGIASMVFERGQTEVESRRLTRTAEADDYHSVLSREEQLQLERCCADLEGEGYEVQPLVIPACAVNAPHRRDRVWIIAHSESGRVFERDAGELSGADVSKYEAERPNGRLCSPRNANCEPHSNAARIQSGRQEQRAVGERTRAGGESSGSGEPHTNTSGDGRGQGRAGRSDPAASREREQRSEQSADGERAIYQGRGDDRPFGESELDSVELGSEWADLVRAGWDEVSWFEAASRLCRVDDGLPDRVDRLKQLGNSVVPVEVYEIFRAIDFAEFTTQTRGRSNEYSDLSTPSASHSVDEIT